MKTLAVAGALERLGLQLARMEMFGARPEEPTKACLEEVEASELFVGIYAHRYALCACWFDVFNHRV